MKILSLKSLLLAIAVLLLINILISTAHNAPADSSAVGRYQVSAWGSAAEVSGFFRALHGYVIIDTTTGQVVDSKLSTELPKVNR